MAETRKPSTRATATRILLIATAERLFAEQGVASVSLNEITRAAGQKNRNAVHYHFGSKQALLRGIFEKHWAHIGALRTELLAELPADWQGFVAKGLNRSPLANMTEN